MKQKAVNRNVIALVVLLAVGLSTGCDSDDQSANAPAAQEIPGGSDRDQIEQVLIGIQADFVAGDGERYCAKLTTAGRDQVERFGRSLRRGETCEETIRRLALITRNAGVKQKPSRLISVRVNGSRALATVRNGDGAPEPMRFIKQGGEWRLPDPGFANPLVGGSTNAK